MTPPISLDAALTLQILDDGGLSAPVPGHFSNGPSSMAPEKGFPFGGLLAALCAQSMRQGLALAAPLRTLSVQYLSAARFGEQVAFRPRLLRGGRNVLYAAVEAEQPQGPLDGAAHVERAGDVDDDVRLLAGDEPVGAGQARTFE